jgi:hypothetical protein
MACLRAEHGFSSIPGFFRLPFVVISGVIFLCKVRSRNVLRGRDFLLGRCGRPRAGYSGRGNPCSRAETSLFSDSGNTPARTSSRGRIGRMAFAERPGSKRLPCIFPVDQGFGPRDEFAMDCQHRHPVCGCRDFAPATRDHPRNSRAFAGSWERGTAESEPETASSGPIAGSGSRLSLLPSLAVRIRFRFAPQGILEVRIPFAPPVGSQNSSATPDRLIVNDEAAHQDVSRQR